MGNPASIVLFVVLGTLSVCLAACGVGFGSGEEPGLITPAQEENPALQGRIQGKVEVEPSFLAAFADSLKSSQSTTSGGVLLAARSLNGRLRVGILGSRRVQSQDLASDGSFSFEGVPEGSYGLSISGDDQVLCRFPLVLTRKSTLELDACFQGWDRRTASPKLAVRWELKHRGRDLEWARQYHPGGAQVTLLPDGTIERFVRGGWVRSEAPDGAISWRRDGDNDFLPDDEERPRQRGTQVADPKVSPSPLIVDLALVNLARPKAGASVVPGDLLLFRVSTASQPSEEVVAVEAELLPHRGPSRRFLLVDDGGEKDLIEPWPGMQISGDDLAGDGVFSYILPIDRTTRELLYSSQLVFQARSRSGTLSHPRLLFLHGEGEAELAATEPPKVSLVRGIRELAFQVRREGDRVWILGSFEARTEVASLLTASLLGPELRRLFVAGSGGQAGWVPFRTTPVLLETGGSLLAIVGTRSGQVYYAGLPLRDLEAVGRDSIIRLLALRRRGG